MRVGFVPIAVVVVQAKRTESLEFTAGYDFQRLLHRLRVCGFNRLAASAGL